MFSAQHLSLWFYVTQIKAKLIYYHTWTGEPEAVQYLYHLL